MIEADKHLISRCEKSRFPGFDFDCRLKGTAKIKRRASTSACDVMASYHSPG